MSERPMETSADAPANFAFGKRERHGPLSHPGVRTKIEMQNALAREDVLLHKMAELTWQQKALGELLGSGEDARARVASLTPRQRQIMLLILAGQRNKNIGADIGISQRTVENHRASMMKKLGTKSLPALVRLALAAVWNRACEPKLGLAIVPLNGSDRR